MSLKAKIQQDLLQSMKDKEEVKLGALRMLKAAIMKLEVSGKTKKEASDDDVMTLINREVKQRKDSIDAFRQGGREEMAAKEEAEMKILMSYMPEQMSEEEVRKIIQETIAASGAQSKSDLGKVMGALMPKVKGKVDGGLVNRLVAEYLK